MRAQPSPGIAIASRILELWKKKIFM